ncbi:LANO_0B06040g1_1 [Lachancea nothofagi CBS 11611]|uniref:Adenosine 5'-monophosphoramidase HNT1 n=1 Tax=Lachancea nothofagi CBS 11611 TaxID=1266666 RepID=A0A1G4IZ06_9SACH|nr:LANO_0B06040g1_1 [Lachancea nothofagi CBS 11611]
MSTPAAVDAACIFCKIIKGEIPSFKLIETKHTFSFLDIQPTAEAHVLVIPKYHGAKLHNVPDENLADILPVTKKLAIALDLAIDSPEGVGYNILQNNGRIAHQIVDHVHFHLIPKRNEQTGLQVGWPAIDTDFEKLGKLHKELLAKLEKSA